MMLHGNLGASFDAQALLPKRMRAPGFDQINKAASRTVECQG